MAAAAISMSASSAFAQDELLSGYVAEMDWKNSSYPISSYHTYTGTQTLFAASKMDAAIQNADVYTIKELVYPLSNLVAVPASGKFEVEISLGKTKEEAMTDWFPESVLTPVFSGIIDLSDADIQSTKCITLPLSTDYVMTKGESLIVTMKTAVTEKFSSELSFGNPYSVGGKHTYYYTSNQGLASFDDVIASNNLPSDITRNYKDDSTSLIIRYVLGGEVAGGEVFEATVAKMDYKNCSYPVNSYANKGKYQGCQTLYSASTFVSEDLKAAPAFAVKELILPFSQMVTSDPTVGKVQVKVYLGASDNTTLDAFIPASELVEVYNGEFDMANPQIQSERALRFPVDADFVVNQGKSLVVGYQFEITEAFNAQLYFGDPTGGGGVHTRYYDNATGPKEFAEDLNGSYSNYVTSLDIKYTLAEPVEEPVGNIGDIIEATIVGGNYSTQDYPICVQSWNLYSASQSLYPASVLDRTVKVEDYTVKELIYPLKTVPSSGKMKVTAMLAKTEAETLSTALPEDAFTVVASGVEIDFSTISDGCLRIPLTRPYIMHKGESMVVGLLADIDDSMRPNPYPAFIDGNIGAGTHTLRSTGDGDPLGITDVTLSEEFVGGLNLVFMIGEEEEPQPVEVVDIAATALTAPAGNIFTGKPYDFTVNVKNNGTETVENYTVEIVNVENDQILASVENPKSILSMLEVSVPVAVTFEQGGNYQLAARVTLEGDEDAENNQTEAVAVEVISLDYKAVSVTGNANAVPGEEETYTVTVANDGSNEIAEYTVELYLVREGMADKLIGSSSENPAIAAGQSVTVDFKYTFELSGNYGLKAVVNVPEGEPSQTPVFDVIIPLEGAISPVITAQLPKWNGSSYAITGTGFFRANQVKTSSQLLFPAEFFGDHANAYQMQSLTLTVVKEEYKNDPMHVRISMAQTERTEGYVKADGAINYVPAEEFELVFDGLLAPVQSEDVQEIELKLQNLFSLENGKSLVLNIECEMTRNSLPELMLASATFEDSKYQVSNTTGDVYNVSRATVRNTLPCITFGYALEPLPAVTDIEATSLTVPTEDVTAGDAATLRVYFENKGTVDIEEYTIELLSIDGAGEATVLESYEGIRYLAPEQSSNQPISYTFAEAGTYKLAARLIVEGDANEANNQTEPVELTVSQKSGVENLLAEGTLGYNAAARTIDVNLGACVVTVCDLAGRAVAVYEVEGAAQLPVSLPAGVYVVNANGKALKIRI